MGFTTSFRIGQLLRYAVDWPEPPAGDGDLERFIAGEVVDAVRRALKAGGCGRTREGMEIGGQFVIGVRSEIFVITEDFAVARVPFAAIGAGRLVAYGALHALAEYDLPIETRVQAALEAAHAYTPGVRPPFGYVATPGRLVPGPHAQWWPGKGAREHQACGSAEPGQVRVDDGGSEKGQEVREREGGSCPVE